MFKNLIGTGSWKYSWALALGLAISPAAWSVPTDVPYIDGVGWAIGEQGDSVEVIPGAWEKLLANPNDIDADTVLTLTEHLYLPIGAGISSWTETILSADWIWIDGSFSSDYGNDPVTNEPGVISVDLKTISFSFPFQDTLYGTPLDTSDDSEIFLTIVKTLQCVAADACRGDFIVVENAVPEPGTLLLLGAGLAGFALRRRRTA